MIVAFLDNILYNKPMKGTTHAAIGANTVWLLMLLPEATLHPLLIVAGAFCALLPDLDVSEAKAGNLEVGVRSGKQKIGVKPLAPLALVFSSLFKHRGFLHSGLVVALLGGITYWLVVPISAELWIIIIAGYISHLLADSLTKSGIKLLYPAKFNFRLLPKSLSLRTGGTLESGILMISLITILLFIIKNMENILEAINFNSLSL